MVDRAPMVSEWMSVVARVRGCAELHRCCGLCGGGGGAQDWRAAGQWRAALGCERFHVNRESGRRGSGA